MIEYQYGDKTVQEFVLLFEGGLLNLEPGFQRKAVWSQNDRKKLIESIFQNYPVPSIFLYKRSENGKLMYDVIDGKQRLESILMFQGLKRFKKGRFSIRTRLAPGDPLSNWDWKKIQNKGHEYRLTSYKIQTVEVSGELSDIIDLFVRINSTGKRLSGAEKRHARYYHSDFLRQARKLAEKHKDYFSNNRILSRREISRMKHIELVGELMASIHVRGNINKKRALDNIISGQSINLNTLGRCSKDFVRTLNLVKKIFPKLNSTRFANAVDFYSLFMLVWNMDKQGRILSDRKRNLQAQKLLEWLSSGVDMVREQIRKAKGAKPEQRLFVNYLLTVGGSTDTLTSRNQRTDVLNQVFGGLFEKKDSQRSFNQEQRRLIWHSDKRKECIECGEPLSWSNFTIDHIKPYALGGPTKIPNAALMCRSCNARKGAH